MTTRLGRMEGESPSPATFFTGTGAASQFVFLATVFGLYVAATYLLGMQDEWRGAVGVFLFHVPGWVLIQGVWVKLVGGRVPRVREFVAGALGPVTGVFAFFAVVGAWVVLTGALPEAGPVEQVWRIAAFVGVAMYGLTYFPAWVAAFVGKLVVRALVLSDQ